MKQIACSEESVNQQISFHAGVLLRVKSGKIENIEIILFIVPFMWLQFMLKIGFFVKFFNCL